ncbi:MAG: efflux transporter outer membrane subunit [Alphaproteobacteria bacterium]|nr:efflux transporter outer membrane subunit [Alphaproteobacteria bacterium]
MAFLLSACSPHPLARDPQPPVAGANSFPSASQPSSIENTEAWWKSFDRPQLNELITMALTSNLTVTQALARMRQAQALAIETRSDIFPQVTLEGNTGNNWQKNNAQRSTSEVGGVLSWEIDVFNRIGSAAKADQLLAEARIEDVKALRLSLSAAVANAYFGAVSAQHRLALLNKQVTTDQELLTLLELRYDNGVGTNVEVLQQQSRVADSRSLIPVAEGDLRVFENRLDVLLGSMPDGSNRVSAEETLSFTTALPPVGVPADLLINRPDLRVARAELVAADADIAAAIADRLPQVTLDGSYVYADGAAFTGPVAIIMGSFVQPLLDWGKRKAAVERNKAIYEEQLAAFGQAYLEAVEDVENALTQEKTQREFVNRLEERREILSNTVSETEVRYKHGVDDYLPVLNALQELRLVERTLITQRLALINNRIALHRASGGAIDNAYLENPLQEQE